MDRQDELAWLVEGWPPQKAQLRILYGRAFDDKLSRAASGEGIALVTPRELFSAD